MANEAELIAEGIADRVLNTPLDLTDSEMDFLTNRISVAKHFDTLVFVCDTCGWWCSTDEMVEDDNEYRHCEDCATELELPA